MPHDSGGVKLKVGDVVLFRATVREIYSGAEADTPMFTIQGEENVTNPLTFMCDAKACTKAQ